MDQRVSLLLLLLMARNGLCQQEEVCSKSLISSCDDCIKSGPYCAWCQALNFTKRGEQEAVRCDTKAILIRKGCQAKEIISPENKPEVIKNDPLSAASDNKEVVQMSPQKINLELRPGLPFSFNVSFKRAEGYPVDLYYLMDLSYSMKDDLDNVKNLAKDLFAALKKITKYARIGFGAFVDKTVLPYTNTNKEKLLKPCDEDYQQCQAAFGYRHVLSMTPNEADFKTKVGEQFISGNLDSPEGSLDAMMQAAVCGDKVGWRNNSTRLIVLTTDAGFHMAGDGKLAGILEPNDERCHMENNIYVKSSEMDYPSVGQLALELEKNNIQTIFAVTKNVEPVYKELSKMIPKSEVGVLSVDSKNVVELIEGAYNALSSKVTMTHDSLPENVRIAYKPICKYAGQQRENQGVCDQVHVGEEIKFEITVTADSCMENKSFTISPQGIKDTLTVTINTKCNCQCEDYKGIPHPHCNNSGSINCGTTVMTMTAFDADDPNTDNAVLRYNIVRQSPDKPSPNMFYIDAERGDIVTVISPAVLDRETLPTTTYELEIVAKDMAGSEVGLTGTATATITITDKNDHAPEFTHPLFEAHVYEGSTGVVVNLTVDDRDDPATGAWRAMYSIISGDPTQNFEIQTNPDNNEGMLSVVKPLDYEASAFRTLLIKVENEDPLVPDVGYGPSSTATVHVRVEDINEGPVFFPDPQIVSRMENIPMGSFVASLNATDPDILEIQSIRYAILQDPAGWLSVNPVRGTVNTSAALDRESPYVYDDKYTAVFIATDNGTPPATGTGTLIIDLEDYNDNAPYVLPSVARVCEDAHDVTVAVVGGWDKDLPHNAAPFKIELGKQPDLNKTWKVTRLNSTHSQIMLLRSLKKDNYQLPLLITDSGDPPLSNNTEVKVQVCICNKNRMHCSSAHSHRARFLVLLATVLLTLFCL